MTCEYCCFVAAGRAEQPKAVIIDSRTLQSTKESGNRAGYDGGKRARRQHSFTLPLILWDICWHYMSPLLMSKTEN